MSEPRHKHIKSVIRDVIVTERFHCSQQRSLQEYDEIEQEPNAPAEDERIRALILNLDTFDYGPSRFLGTMVALLNKLGTMGRRFAVCRMQSPHWGEA